MKRIVHQADRPVCLILQIITVMTKNILKLAASIIALFAPFASNAAAPVLKFRPDSTFHILQVTDLHYIHADSRCDSVIPHLTEAIRAEAPDLVMLTGDLIYGHGRKSMEDVISAVSSTGVPFAVTFGNHDDEQGLSRRELFDIIRSYPGNLTDSVAGIPGVTNFILPVLSSDGKRDAAALYCFDSHSYCRIPGVKGYDYIKAGQIDWYRSESQRFAEANGGRPLPSVAFFHIPLPEFAQAAADQSMPLAGTRGEKCCSPALNSGLFAAFKERGDVFAVFVGHDHDNDYATVLHGIILAYGRYSGGNTEYNHLGPRGYRTITLRESRPYLSTAIRLYTSAILHPLTFPMQ